MTYFNIEHRTLASDELRYKATVFIKKDGCIVHPESKTFKKKTLANSYGKSVPTILTQMI
ncbi:Integrase [Vibrio neonatus]